MYLQWNKTMVDGGGGGMVADEQMTAIGRRILPGGEQTMTNERWDMMDRQRFSVYGGWTTAQGQWTAGSSR